jgi:YidC/Oxa1 family membrane protein insertase
VKIFDGLSTAVAFVLKHIHAGLSNFLPDASGWAWGLSIVFLTMTVRILLFPLFVKQIKSQRRMQELAPKVKELQTKHKGDRETLNTELMKLYKDHGTNPISGCLPLIMQLPIFFALFRVMNEFRPHGGDYVGKYGLSDTLIEQGARAKIFGAPISAAFNSPGDLLKALDGNATTVKIVAAVMVILMGATTFFTQRQMMARNGAALDPQQAQVQKIMLYVLPLSFAVFGFSFPIGVLLYWLTTNVWSMGQQAYVIKRMPPVVPGAGTTGKSGGKSGGKPESKPEPSKGSVATSDEPKEPAPKPTPARPTPARGAAGARKHKKRKGGRR